MNRHIVFFQKMTDRKKYYILYTFIFCVVASIVFMPFYLNGKSFVWWNDGATQHYNAFVYIGKWGRNIINSLLQEHKLVIPLWEFGLGYGADVITTLAYYVLGDPLTLISVCTPIKYAETVYGALIILRFYLSGIAFSTYARKMECSRFGCLCGAFAYSFCAYALYGNVKHMFFGNAFIYLPLVLLGIEKIFKKESPTIYIISIFITAISNFYFFYKIVLITILYVIIRYIFMEEKNLKDFARKCGAFFGYALIGVMMAMPILLPIVETFIGNARMDSTYIYDTFYSIDYYKEIFLTMITPTMLGEWTFVGMTPICFWSLFALYSQKKDDKWLKLIIIIIFLLLLLPVAGVIFNGFGYSTNRWSFSYALFGAIALAKYSDSLLELSVKKQMLATIICFIYCVAQIGIRDTLPKGITAIIIYFIFILVYMLVGKKIEIILPTKLRIKSSYLLQVGIFLFTIGGIFLQSHSLYQWDNNYISEFHDAGTVLDKMCSNDSAYELIEDDSFYRTDTNYLKYYAKADSYNRNVNSFTVRGQSSTSMYWNLLSSNISSYMNLNSAYSEAVFVLSGLNSRSLLLPFASAKYFLGVGSGIDKNTVEVPYGYNYVGETKNGANNTISVYQSDYSLPFGYTSAAYLTESEYESLDIEERQQAMLYGTVIEDSNAKIVSVLDKAHPIYSDENLEYTVECDENMRIEGNKIIVEKPFARMKFLFTCPAERELYIKISNLEYDGESVSSYINAYAQDWASSVIHFTDKHIHAQGRDDYLLNLYYSDEDRTYMNLTFAGVGTYTFDELELIAQPMDILGNSIPNMTEDILENCEFSANVITGNISLDEDKILCFSLPYSKGWKLYVNNEETELIRTNIMYTGVVLSAGEHDIRLEYCTPYLLLGSIISVVGFVFFIVTIIIFRKNRKNSL